MQLGSRVTVAVALTPPLAWELPHVAGGALKKKKKKKDNNTTNRSSCCGAVG